MGWAVGNGELGLELAGAVDKGRSDQLSIDLDCRVRVGKSWAGWSESGKGGSGTGSRGWLGLVRV